MPTTTHSNVLHRRQLWHCLQLERNAMLLLLACLVRPTAEMPMTQDDSYVASSKPRDDLITITESGRVRGIRYHVPYLPRPVDAYLGIPFAQPPLNYLRFKHPQPIENWSGVYNATRLPNSCYQLPDMVFGSEFQVGVMRFFLSTENVSHCN